MGSHRIFSEGESGSQGNAVRPGQRPDFAERWRFVLPTREPRFAGGSCGSGISRIQLARLGRGHGLTVLDRESEAHLFGLHHVVKSSWPRMELHEARGAMRAPDVEPSLVSVPVLTGTMGFEAIIRQTLLPTLRTHKNTTQHTR